MATIMFGMNQSLDGHVATPAGELTMPPPDPALFRHYIGRMAGVSASLYGRRIYELMRYWEEDQADWGPEERAFAEAWRATPKHVVSTTLTEVGPNATLIQGDVEAAVRRLKAELEGEIEVAGPELAGHLSAWGLIDNYWLYFRPHVLGEGKPFFAQKPPALRLEGHELVGENTVLLRYALA